MGQLVFQATLGGQVNLVGPNTASTYNLNVPAVASTLATLAAQTFADTQTFTVDAVVNGLTVGRGAGAVSTNTAVGNSALAANQAGGNQNTAVGISTLANNTTGSSNSAFGRQALASTTTGGANTAVGVDALVSNTTASNNTAVGYQAGYTNTTGTGSNYVGRQAGYLSNANYCTMMGDQAGYSSTGVGNTFFGYYAGNGVTSGTNNSFLGYGAGYSMTTGSKNTILGGYNGNQGGLDIRTASNYCVLSDGDGNIAGRWVNGGGWFQLNNSASWSTTSDARIKENIETITNGLDVVMALRPVEFDYKLSSQHMAGFLAQEYELILPDQITEESNVSDEIKELTNGEAVKGIQQNLVPYLVSAIQSLKAEFDAYKAAHP